MHQITTVISTKNPVAKKWGWEEIYLFLNFSFIL